MRSRASASGRKPLRTLRPDTAQRGRQAIGRLDAPEPRGSHDTADLDLRGTLAISRTAPVGFGAIGSIARLSRSILPQTRLGWIALRLFVAFFVLSAATSAIVTVSGGHPWLGVLVIPLGAAALGGGIAAVVSIVRHGERGALVLMPMIVGLLALVFVAGEVFVPH